MTEQKDITGEGGVTVITAGMTIIGDVVGEGSVELLGNLTGNVDISGKLNIVGTIEGNAGAGEVVVEAAQLSGNIKSEGATRIGRDSVVIGNISAGNVNVAGAVKGDFDVHGQVVLEESAVVIGNIKSQSVEMNNGVIFEGTCSQCYADVSPADFFEKAGKGK